MKEINKYKSSSQPEKLLSRFNAGEPDALKQLHDLQYKSLFAYCNRLLEDHFQAEEIVMDTFLKLWQRRAAFQSLPAIVHYIFAVSKNACIDQLRKRKTARSNIKSFTRLTESATTTEDTELIRAQLYQLAILEAEDFPPKMKKVFMMIFRDGLSPQEAADALGVSIHTVKTHRKFALKVLRQSLAKRAFNLFSFLFF